MEQAILVIDDGTYPDDRVRISMARIRAQIDVGLEALGRATESEGRPGERAVDHIGNTLEQAQGLYLKVRDR